MFIKIQKFREQQNISILFFYFFFMLIIICSESYGQGKFTNIKFYSSSLKMDRDVQIYLPKDYNPLDSIRYPVIYFLHGALGNHNSNSELLGILNDLIDNTTISTVIVVKPDGSVGPWGGSFYSNSELYGNFEDYIAYDLIEFIDSTYKTIASRGKRSIMGHSMGAYGAIKLSLKHPDLFCAVASHSGPLDFSHWPDRIPRVLSENGGSPVSSFTPTLNSLMTYLFFTVAGALSPNLTNSPYPVDFPIDNMGNLIDSTFNRWLSHDPARLVSNITQESDLSIYFDCGTQDELLTYPFNTGFADSLDKHSLEYDFQSFNGGHVNQLTTRLPIALKFLDSVMKSTVGVEDKKNNKSINCSLYQNYPNPFNSQSHIRFSIPDKSYITLKVYDILGKEVGTLISDYQPAGLYNFTFDSNEITNGIYIYRLTNNNVTISKKMTILK